MHMLPYWKELFLEDPHLPLICLASCVITMLCSVAAAIRKPSLLVLCLPLLSFMNVLAMGLPKYGYTIQIIIFLFGAQILSIYFRNHRHILTKMKHFHSGKTIDTLRWMIEQFGFLRSMSILAEVVLSEESTTTPFFLCLVNFVITVSGMVSLTVMRKFSNGHIPFGIQSVCFMHAVGFQLSTNPMLSEFLNLPPKWGLDGVMRIQVLYRCVVIVFLSIVAVVACVSSKRERTRDQALIQQQPQA